jgi:hypothetical protein
MTAAAERECGGERFATSKTKSAASRKQMHPSANARILEQGIHLAYRLKGLLSIATQSSVYRNGPNTSGGPGWLTLDPRTALVQVTSDYISN